MGRFPKRKVAFILLIPLSSRPKSSKCPHSLGYFLYDSFLLENKLSSIPINSSFLKSSFPRRAFPVLLHMEQVVRGREKGRSRAAKPQA